MDSSIKSSSLTEQLNAICDIWFNRKTSRSSDAVAAYTVLLETVNAYTVSAPQITNLLLPRLGLTKGGAITDMENLGRLAMQRLVSAEGGKAPGHYEVDNALRCALMITQEGQPISDTHEQQVKPAIQSSLEQLQEPPKDFG